MKRFFFYLNIGDELIKPVSLVKQLGVLIDDNLSFNEHVSKLCVKAARQTNAKRRIVTYIPNKYRLNIYQAFIFPNFIYCDIVWHFCSNRNTYKIEKVHKNALRVTLNDYTSSYPDILEVVKRPMLYICRIICMTPCGSRISWYTAKNIFMGPLLVFPLFADVLLYNICSFTVAKPYIWRTLYIH